LDPRAPAHSAQLRNQASAVPGKGLVSLTARLRSPVTLLAALALLGIPTTFTLFPEAVKLPVWVRIVVGLAWLGLAGYVVNAGRVRERRIDRWTVDQEIENRNRLARISRQVIASLLENPGQWGFPGCYSFFVYTFRADEEMLRPVWPELSSVPEHGFPPGTGATGTAWKTSDTVVALGDAVSNQEYGLTPEQQEYYRAGRVAAAAVIFDRVGARKLGVLTIYSEDDDGYFAGDDPAGVEGMRDIAAVLGSVFEAVSSET
jgi:hypothetical protein